MSTSYSQLHVLPNVFKESLHSPDDWIFQFDRYIDGRPEVEFRRRGEKKGFPQIFQDEITLSDI